ncbi:uncharacterized protein N7515_005969 [Penicillium bovifimosum]|uniref:RING-type domain-containing protein n=1 Tax=Penicillium bovifimosum TaxID=126998 RepID=A0A9W9GTR9_9EURO|nr:uncharacterized protein N7515_005969 [Penicillium bovifimosum]KAJ5129930.1 hypothetical protein N7515_005969 [Penicillium bovifimosum]
MAAADPPGLMDIASTLAQEDIPFKLRCAMCNNLAVNAFRLPCCDQSICETCQASLSETCPVCTHTPVSPDLCKPNKALRTTLKAFLRTEEKKREKDRQSAAPSATPAPSDTTPADTKAPVPDTARDQNGPAAESTQETEAPLAAKPGPEGVGQDISAGDTAAESDQVGAVPDSVDQPALNDTGADPLQGTGPALEPAPEDAVANDSTVSAGPAPFAQEFPDQFGNNPMAPNMAGNMPVMGWNGNGMNPYMAGMFNYPNTMGMPMGMGPMANQGMIGDYGMNMAGMGMNNGMNYDGSMYGSLGWDASQQNNVMWQGGQNKFNPNAFANGGPPYGGAVGSNMSAYPSHSGYQSGYHGGYGRGGYRGRGRGQFYGSGRGGYGPMQGHYRQGANPAYAHQPPAGVAGAPDGTAVDAQGNVPPNETAPDTGEGGAVVSGNPEDISKGDTEQPQGIPTIESLDSNVPPEPGYNPMSNGYGQSRFGGFEQRGPGVEGAPAAPRAMRQGLPNTSVLRQRNFQIHGRASSAGEPTEQAHARATSAALSSRAQPPSRSPSQNGAPQARSPSVHGPEDDRDSRRETDIKRKDRVDELQSDARTRSPSRASSRRSSRRRHHESDRERDQRSGHRSQRSRRHRSRSRSTTRNEEIRPKDRSNGRTKASSEAPEARDLASRISSRYRSKERASRREDDKSRDHDHDSRRRDRDRDRDRRDRNRESDRDRRRDGERDKDRGSERDRDRLREHGRDRGGDRKRSRRDRSPSANGSEHPQARRAKHGDEDRSRDTNGVRSTEAEKDPYTLEREARNKERLEREKQHREKTKSGRRRDSRQDRGVGGRRINYKYEDEL